MLESYTEAFHELKPAQQLTLFPALGMVELEIELEDRTLHLNVEPIHASIIHLFEEQGTIYITIAIDR
jgi:anaphase-promoting complex subunit 2